VIGTNVKVKEQSAEELALISEDFETAPASKIVGWAVDTYGDSIVLAASFEDIVLIDLAAKIDPGIEVVFLDTEAHFPETLSFVEEIRARYDLNLTVTRPGPEALPTRVAPPSAANSARSSRSIGQSTVGEPG
jgi:phosphoadenosine phosphosulfate reductase